MPASARPAGAAGRLSRERPRDVPHYLRMTRIIDGKAQAAALRRTIAACSARLAAEHGIRPGLAVILAGGDPASQLYVRNKQRAAETCGFHAVTFRRPGDLPKPALLGLIAELNADPAIHGILVQLPLPAGLDAAPAIAAIDPQKDVDGLHPLNAGRLALGLPGLVPCTPSGCLLLAKSVHHNLAGLEAVIIGRSALVGKPLAALLLAEDCTVTIAHSRTRDLPALAARADLLVAAAGRPGLVRAGWIKPGASVIDVGINRIEQKGRTRFAGDVAYEEACAVAGAIAPVPGGVGPMTVACLLRNTLLAACRQNGLPDPRLEAEAISPAPAPPAA